MTYKKKSINKRKFKIYLFRHYNPELVRIIMESLSNYGDLLHSQVQVGLYVTPIRYKLGKTFSQGLAVYPTDNVVNMSMFILYDEFKRRFYLSVSSKNGSSLFHLPLNIVIKYLSSKSKEINNMNLLETLPKLQRLCDLILEEQWKQFTVH